LAKQPGKIVSPPAEALLQAMTVGVVAMDRDLNITAINRLAAKIVSLPAEQIIGRPCHEVFKSSLCEADCPVKRALSTGQEQHGLDAVIIRQEGRSVYPVSVSAAPLFDQNGHVIGGVETLQGLQLSEVLERTNENTCGWADFVGASAKIARIFDTLKVAAPSDITILIEGSTGTGKGLLAQIIHQQSPRRKRPFVKVNCAALPENLLESELFGYLRGAFTGAERDKPGRFQLAEGGTIFLDEISEMPLSLQAKLLRVIEDKEFYPLGARNTYKANVRIIAACNRPLDQQVAAGHFREDLFYRLNVIRIHIPPLAERREDIPLLIRRFIQRKNIERGTYICRFSPSALDLLLNYDYPGNVRELENLLEHACLLCQGDIIQEDHLPWSIRDQAAGHTRPPEGGEPIDPATAARRQRLMEALIANDFNRTKTAAMLGIDRTTLWRRMKRYGIQVN